MKIPFVHGSSPALPLLAAIASLAACSPSAEAPEVPREVQRYDAETFFDTTSVRGASFSADGDTEIVRGDKSTNQFAVFYLADGKVVAADAVNSPKEFMLCKQLIGKPVDTSVLEDPEGDLKSLLA